MSRTAVLSDQVWEQIEPLLPSSDGRRGRPFRPHRQVVEGIIYRYRTGILNRAMRWGGGFASGSCASATVGQLGVAPSRGRRHRAAARRRLYLPAR